MQKSINYFTYLIYILPAAIVSGPFLSDAIVSITAIFFLFYCIKNRDFSGLDNIFFKIFFVFWIYIVISSIFSIETFSSLKTTIPYIRFALFTCFIMFLIKNNKNFVNNFSIFLIIFFTIVLLDSYVQYFFGSNILGIQSPHPSRLSSFFGEEMIVGSFLSRLFSLVLFSILILSKNYNKNIQYLSAIFLILTDVIIFLTGERTSFGILLIINVGFILLINKMKLLRIVTFIISIFIISFIALNNNIVKDRMINQTIDEFGIKENNIKAFSVVHQDHYETAINMFKKNPISGVGVKMFRYECHNKEYLVGEWGCTSHPHHLYIQILAETGLIGFIFILIIIFFLIKKFLNSIILSYFKKHKLNENMDFRNCILIGIFANIFPFLPSGNIFNNWLSIVYFLPVGFYIYSLKDDRS